MSADAKQSGSPAQRILDFWLGDGLTNTLGWPSDDRSKLWYGGGAALDQQVQDLFGKQVDLALNGQLCEWEQNPLSLLALVILLDQFTRNVYRGQAQAFAGDSQAQALAGAAIAGQKDLQLPFVGRVFLCMPLMHAENSSLQDLCVHQFTQLHQQAAPELKAQLQSNLKFAQQHRDIVARFGRFAHRNQALGRVNTPAEEEFLKNGPRFGQ